ncbi:MAG: cation:proton antiporter [Pseudomonadota bacterium]
MHDSSIAIIVSAVVGLLLIASGIMALSRWWRIPFTVMLVLAGIVIAQIIEHGPPVLNQLQEFEISAELILLIFLPTLIFESAFNLDSRQLRQNLLPVLALAIPGVLLSTGMIGGFLWLVTPFDLPSSLILGAMLSATDPVAVIALFKQLGAPKRLTILVEGESLFNDATAIVLTKILIAIAVAGYVTMGDVAMGGLEFFGVFFGGLIVGWLLALMTGYLLGKIESDPFLETQLTLILAYLSFLVAEELFHVSGVMATVAAGVTMGGWGRTKISPSVAEQLTHMWEYFAFVANALIFLLVGLLVDLSALMESFDLLLLAIFAMLVSRAIVVYGLIPIVGRLPNTEPIDMPYRTVMYWGGLRGAIAIALALSLSNDFQYRETFIAIIAGVVLFTLLVQGLSIERLVKYLGLDKPPLGDRLAQVEGQISTTHHALEQIPELQAGGLFSARIAVSLRTRYEQEETELRERLENLRSSELDPEQERRIMYIRGFAAEKNTYYALFGKGHLSEQTYRDLAHSLQVQTDTMRHRGELPKFTLHSKWRMQVEQTFFNSMDRFGFGRWVEEMRNDITARQYEKSWGQYQGSTQVLEELDSIARRQSVRSETLEEVRKDYSTWKASAQRRLDETAEQFPEFVNAMQERLARRTLIQGQREMLEEQIHSGVLTAGVAEPILEELSDEFLSLRGHVAQELRVDASELLRKVPFFQGIPAAEFDEIAQVLRAHTIPAGNTIIRQGDAGDSLFLIARGVVRISRTDDDVEHDLATLLAGDFFGEMALLRQEPRTATSRAVTPCALYELKREPFQKLCQSRPSIQQALEAVEQGRRQDNA